jgi:hypothetical protein
VNLYQDCSNYSPGVKIAPAPRVIDFQYIHIVKNQKKSYCLMVQGTRLQKLKIPSCKDTKGLELRY